MVEIPKLDSPTEIHIQGRHIIQEEESKEEIDDIDDGLDEGHADDEGSESGVVKTTKQLDMVTVTHGTKGKRLDTSENEDYKAW